LSDRQDRHRVAHAKRDDKHWEEHSRSTEAGYCGESGSKQRNDTDSQ
jgi:hypothetical protein